MPSTILFWSDNPLSVYAKANKTIVDGIVYFDRERDKELRKQISAERNRLVQKMIAEGRNNPKDVIPARPSMQLVLHCEDYEHSDGLFQTDSYEATNNENQ